MPRDMKGPEDYLAEINALDVDDDEGSTYVPTSDPPRSNGTSLPSPTVPIQTTDNNRLLLLTHASRKKTTSSSIR
jgi:hypothetical protein